MSYCNNHKSMEKRHFQRMPSSLSSSSSCSSLPESDDELIQMPRAPPRLKNKKRLSKQLSMCESPRDLAWERRRQQMLRLDRRKNGAYDVEDLTDEDWTELKGCIELGFAFNEENARDLSATLPALDLYIAVNRQLSPSPVSTPRSAGSTSSMGRSRSTSSGSPKSDSDTWKIFSPGEDPEQVKMKLKHWAQAVTCSVMQSSDYWMRNREKS